jgi:Fe2+ transport system protein FeoA
LGIRPGAHIQIIGKTTGSGLILKVEENRVAIHRSMADQIEIDLLEGAHV